MWLSRESGTEMLEPRSTETKMKDVFNALAGIWKTAEEAFMRSVSAASPQVEMQREKEKKRWLRRLTMIQLQTLQWTYGDTKEKGGQEQKGMSEVVRAEHFPTLTTNTRAQH